MDALARRLLAGRTGLLDAPELDAVLSWLAGGQRHGALQLSVTLGRPQDHPDRVAAFYQLLDRQLLGAGRLDAQAAQLSGQHRPESEKKARFRRLIQAFHPDRYPELAGWLTPRAQLIHQSYAAFKRGEPLPAAASQPARPSGWPKTAAPGKPEHPWQPGPFRRSAKLVPDRTGPVRRLLLRLAGSPRLTGSLIAGLAMVTLLPLVLIHFADERANATNLATVTTSPAAVRPPESGPTSPGAAQSAFSERHLPEQAASVRGLTAAEPAPASDATRDEPARQYAWAAEAAAGSLPEPATIRVEIELLMQRLGRYVSSGDLEALVQLMDHSQAEDAGAQMAERFDRIIAGSRRRHQEFQVLSIEHQPPEYWAVQTLSRLTMAFDDLTARHEESRHRVIVRQAADGQLRIAGFDG